MTEEWMASIQDDVDELVEDVQALTRELLNLNGLVAVLSEIVRPGLEDTFRAQMDFIAEASKEIIRLEEGKA